MALFRRYTLILFLFGTAPAFGRQQINPNVKRMLLKNSLVTLDQNSNGDGYNLKGVLPDTYWVYTDSDHVILAELVEQLVETIFSTRAGQTLCSFMDNTEDRNTRLLLTKALLGLRKKSAQKIIHYCLPHIKTETLGYKIPTQLLWNTILRQPKVYKFVITAEKTKLSSFTSRFNETFLFLNPEEIDFNHLIARLAHELAIYFDRKNQPDIFWYDYQVNAIGHIQTTAEKCYLLKSLADPAIKTALMTLRAFSFEKALVQEIAPSQELTLPITGLFTQLPFSTAKQCKRQLRSFLSGQKKLWQFYSTYNALYFLSLPILTGCLNFDYRSAPYSQQQIIQYVVGKGASQDLLKMIEDEIEQNLDVLLNADFIFHHQQPQAVSFCEYITRPVFGRIIKPLMRGPRPRIAGW